MNSPDFVPCDSHAIGSLIYKKHPTENYTFNCSFINFLSYNKNKVVEFLLDNINPLSISTQGNSVKDPHKLCNRRSNIVKQCTKFNITTIHDLTHLDKDLYNSFFKHKYSLYWLNLVESIFLNRGLSFHFSRHNEYSDKYKVYHLNSSLGESDPWYVKKLHIVSVLETSNFEYYNNCSNFKY